ncbi:ABC transporter ATP-binding protein [Echinicola sp. 20G]|uniref:ABC transporter ATP-binding protein n=1 Tax=Echinicola sp. 20G TaxID=2781961 RepID=UPI001910F15D|nr:ABC transporter ATP-binding protein [Echinicola sp. 20G]
MVKDKHILTGQNVSIGYKKGKSFKKIGTSLTFELQKEKLTCLLGPNGVGKSTLIKTIMGQLPSLEGSINFGHLPVQEIDAKSLAKKISVVLTDRISPGNLSVEQLVSLGRTPFTNWIGKLTPEDKEMVVEAMKATKTYYLKDQLVSELSDGQLQKVMIARALAQDGDLIILDEPTAHLDLVNRYEIMHLLREVTQNKHKSILVITHDLDIAIETSDELWIMQCGDPLLCGTPEDLILSGKINKLLPSDELSFDSNTGKIRPKSFPLSPSIKGPQPITQWLNLALQKNSISLSEETSIHVTEAPLTFEISRPNLIFKAKSIQEVIHFLLKNS